MMEANICIGTEPITQAESMTLRVALTSWLTDIAPENSLGTDQHGKFMRKAYLQHGQRVLRMILERCVDNEPSKEIAP